MFKLKPLQLAHHDTHIKSLDGLRGLAIIIVMLYHFFPSKFPMGWMGVDLFFVLSGFLITGILLRTKDSPHYYRNYIAKRILRIFPLYYFLLILFFIVFYYGGFSNRIPDYDYLTNTQIWYWLYLQNWQIFFNTIYPQQDILSHFWSLAIEEQFYIFWPMVVLITPNHKIGKVCVALLMFSFILRLFFLFQFDFTVAKIYVFTLTRLDGLSVGSVIAVMIRDSNHLNSLNRYSKPFFLATGLCLLITIIAAHSFSFDSMLMATYGYSVIALFFGSLLLITVSKHSNNIFRKVTENDVFSFFGKYSYGLYIYHLPVLWLVPKYLKLWTNSKLLITLLCILISIAIAFISYHLIEKQFLKWKRKFV
jgi:peptidoglycan/LPS O-acetylase OafA/YrhL